MYLSACLLTETSRRCGIFFKVFGLHFPQDEDCDSLPDSTNSDECIGHHEMELHDKQEQLVGNYFILSSIYSIRSPICKR